MGHLVCLPEIVQKDQKLTFKSWDQHTKMKIGKFGIQVPLSKKVVIPNYLLVPIVSCDLFKNRLDKRIDIWYSYTIQQNTYRSAIQLERASLP